IGENLERAVTVVGVVPDTRYRDLREARPSVYFPMRQPFFPFEPLTLAIRTTGSPAELRSEEHTSELQSQSNIVCRLLLEKQNTRQHVTGVAHRPCFKLRSSPAGRQASPN